MLPPQLRQVLQQRVVQSLAVATQGSGGTLHIDRVPQHDGRRHQIEAAGPVALLFTTAVADFTLSAEEGLTRLRVARLALIQPRMDAAAQLHALQPIQNEQPGLDAPQLAQRGARCVAEVDCRSDVVDVFGRHTAGKEAVAPPHDLCLNMRRPPASRPASRTGRTRRLPQQGAGAMPTIMGKRIDNALYLRHFVSRFFARLRRARSEGGERVRGGPLR